MRTITKWLTAFGAVGMILFLACNKDSSSKSNPNIPPGQSQLSVYLTDGPVQFYKVLVDIRQVAVKIDTSMHQHDEDNDHEWGDEWSSHTIWDTLNITPGVYDLLQLRNGVDTLIASGTYPSGKILKVRVTLGSDNSIFTDSATSFPLDVFGPHPYFDINVKREHVYDVSSNDFKLWLDFNLQRSIFFWSGTFYLKPYIVAFNDHASARISGSVLPPGSSPLIQAYNNVDTVYAVPGFNGDYIIRAVPPGTYTLNIYGHHGFSDTTITNIVVSDASTTKVPTITLHK